MSWMFAARRIPLTVSSSSPSEPPTAAERYANASLVPGGVRIAGLDGSGKRGDRGSGELVLCLFRLLAFGDVRDQYADPCDVLSVPYRIEDRGPMTDVAGTRGGHTAHLDVEYRFAGVQDPVVVRFDLRPQGRDDLGYSPPDMLLHRRAIDRRQRVVDAHVSEVAINEPDTHRRAGLQRVEKRERIRTDIAGAGRI